MITVKIVTLTKDIINNVFLQKGYLQGFPIEKAIEVAIYWKLLTQNKVVDSKQT